MGSSSDPGSTKSTDSKKNISKKFSKKFNGICNTAFTLEEKLQEGKGYSNFKNSEDAKSSDEDANTSTVTSTINSPNIDSESEKIAFKKAKNKSEDDSIKKLDDEECSNCKQDKSDKFSDSIKFDKDCNICFANPSKANPIRDSEIQAVVQNLNCSLNILSNSSSTKCSKCTNLPEYVQQLSNSSSDLKSHQNGFHNLQSAALNNSLQKSEEHNVVMPNSITDQSQSTNKILSALKGVFLAFLSSIFFSLTTVIVKYVKEVDAGQMAIYRFAGMLLFVFPIVIDSKKPIFGPLHLRIWILLRGFAGASSLYLRYSTLHYLPISNATVIVLSMPVFVCIFGRIFLKEACGLFHVVALGVTLVGIAFTSKLDVIIGGDKNGDSVSRQNEIYGLISGLSATLVGSSAYILVRKVKELDYSVILFNFAWVAMCESFIITYTIHDGIKLPSDNITPWLLFALGILSFYGQMLLTRALQAEEAALVSVTRSASEVFFAFLFQIIIFRQMPTLTSVIGAALVTSAVMLTSVRKYVVDLSEEHLMRRIFWFTLK